MSSESVLMTNPLKQGLKRATPGKTQRGIGVVMTNPLKQGLKPDVFAEMQPTEPSRNDESTKTRIETKMRYLKQFVILSRNDESTKTRIET